MSSTSRSKTASEVLTPPAEGVRACSDRQQRLTEYIRGHTGEDIAVRLTPSVPTACVMPASEETLAEAEDADISTQEAEQLTDSIDANYLVLISTAPATLDRLPINDQLTADRAQQFGYALHELGHIRYTAIAESASKIESRIEDEHQDFVQGLWNACEDAAIEHQLANDQSQLAADRLEIVNRSISRLADEISPEQSTEFSFRDAIESALYDRGIYNTGKCGRLVDPEDNSFVFVSDDDRQAFEEIDESIDNLLATILATPQSVERVDVLIEWWKAEIKPLLSPPDNKDGTDQQNQEQAADNSTSDERSQIGNGSPSEQSHDESDTGQDSSSEGNDESPPDPSSINTDQRQDSPGTDALEYPDIGNKEEADTLQQASESDDSPDGAAEDDTSGVSSEIGSNTDSDSDHSSESSSDSDSDTRSDTRSDSDTTTANSNPEGNNGNNDKQNLSASLSGSDSTEDNPWIDDSENTQSSLASFAGDDSQANDDQEGNDENSIENSTGGEQDNQADEKPDSKTVNQSESATEEDGSQEFSPAEPTPAHDASDLSESNALQADQEGAHNEVEQSRPDETQLENDLQEAADALDALDGGDGASPGSLDELAIMPNPDHSGTGQQAVNRWNEADADAEYVADALRKALKQSRKTSSRSGLTSGTFDRRRVGALARGEINTFQVRQQGDEKQYDLVLILDRSHSMRDDTSASEDALVRFAIACEEVGINVGIIDFYDDDARLIKPFSVGTRHVQEGLFSGESGGGTPLADALGIGRELLEQRRNDPLVIIVTDGKPGDAEAYHDELEQSYAPVCGLTLSLDTTRGNVPDRVAQNEQFYDRHMYVHEEEQIANRLDQFAVMFSGL